MTIREMDILQIKNALIKRFSEFVFEELKLNRKQFRELILKESNEEISQTAVSFWFSKNSAPNWAVHILVINYGMNANWFYSGFGSRRSENWEFRKMAQTPENLKKMGENFQDFLNTL